MAYKVAHINAVFWMFRVQTII